MTDYRVVSGVPTMVVLTCKRYDLNVLGVVWTMMRRHLPLGQAKERVATLFDHGHVTVELPMVEDIAALREELAASRVSLELPLPADSRAVTFRTGS